MDRQFSEPAASTRLGELSALVGATGLVAAAERPALLAAVDQHAAAVRDRLFADVRPLTERVLAAYAEGLRDAAYRHGWRPPVGRIDWTVNDWVLVRLLAVCALARTLR